MTYFRHAINIIKLSMKRINRTNVKCMHYIKTQYINICILQFTCKEQNKRKIPKFEIFPFTSLENKWYVKHITNDIDECNTLLNHVFINNVMYK